MLLICKKRVKKTGESLKIFFTYRQKKLRFTAFHSKKYAKNKTTLLLQIKAGRMKFEPKIIFKLVPGEKIDKWECL